MKYLIVLACLLAIAYANEDAKVLRNDAEVNKDNFKYSYELDNHVKAEQTGDLKDKDNWVVHGAYEWVDPKGEHVEVKYHADENGYHPESAWLPTPPPIPAHILKAIAYIEAHPYHEESHH